MTREEMTSVTCDLNLQIYLDNATFLGRLSELARNVNMLTGKTIIDSSYANCNDSWFFFGFEQAEND
jgi:hypothetical protein